MASIGHIQPTIEYIHQRTCLFKAGLFSTALNHGADQVRVDQSKDKARPSDPLRTFSL
jgi:hypothetical protein